VSGKRRNYSPEFKDEAARMVVDSSRPIAHVAREIGVHEITLGSWIKAYRGKAGRREAPLDLPERARLRELERRNRELEMENAFLKKAAAYVCPER
jgi:transposase